MRGIKDAVLALAQGGVIVYPTETAYALGCDATNARAVRRIFKIKGRKREKALPLIVADVKMAERYVVMTPLAKKLTRKFWPGPLTLVLRIRNYESGIRKLYGVGKGGTVALRVSAHPVARELARRLGRPIVATSANRSGEPACYSVRCVRKQLPRMRSVVILGAGTLPRRPPSTIVEATGSVLKILRQGGIKL